MTLIEWLADLTTEPGERPGVAGRVTYPADHGVDSRFGAAFAWWFDFLNPSLMRPPGGPPAPRLR